MGAQVSEGGRVSAKGAGHRAAPILFRIKNYVLKLYNRERSGNCYKARLMLSLLGIEYENQQVHREGKGRNILPADFERLNPLRQIPVLLVDDRPYWGTIAILVYLARKYGGEQQHDNNCRLRADYPDAPAPHRQIGVPIHEEAEEEFQCPRQDRGADHTRDSNGRSAV